MNINILLTHNTITNSRIQTKKTGLNYKNPSLFSQIYHSTMNECLIFFIVIRSLIPEVLFYFSGE